MKYAVNSPSSPVQSLRGRDRTMLEQRFMMDILLEDGLAGQDYIDASVATLQSAASVLEKKDLTPEQKAGAARQFTKIIGDMSDGIDNSDAPQSTKEINKMALAR